MSAPTPLAVPSRLPARATVLLSRGAPVMAAALTLLVVLPGIATPSLWLDEGATIAGSTRSLPDLVRMAGTIDAVHAAYYAFMHGWIELFGQSAIILRLPSALATAIAAAGVHVLARRLGDDRLAWWATAVFVLLPRVTWMAIEARSFAFSAALAVWVTVLLTTALRRRRFGWWAAYALVASVGVAVNIYVALVIVGHGITVLIVSRERVRAAAPWLTASIGAALLVSPLVLEATSQTGQLPSERSSVGTLLQNIVVNQWFLGATPTQVTGEPAVDITGIGMLWRPAALGLTAVVLAMTAWAVVAGVRARRSAAGRPAAPGSGSTTWRILAWTLPWILVPVALLAVYSLLVSNLYNPRYLTFTTPAAAILIGLVLSRLRPRRVRVIAAALAALLVVPVYAVQREEYGKSNYDWGPVAAHIQADSTGRDGLLLDEQSAFLAVSYPDELGGLVDLTFAVDPAENGTLSAPSRPLDDLPPLLAGIDSVWVVHDRADGGDAQRALLTSQGFREVSSWTATITTVDRFER